jgi:hypothetical protein
MIQEADYREYLKEEKENIASEMADPQSPTFNATAEKIAAFDIIFDQMAHESESFAKMDADKNTVGRDDLQKRLVASGFFNQDEALTIIAMMIRKKRIKEVKWDTYRRANGNSNIKEQASS